MSQPSSTSSSRIIDQVQATDAATGQLYARDQSMVAMGHADTWGVKQLVMYFEMYRNASMRKKNERKVNPLVVSEKVLNCLKNICMKKDDGSVRGFSKIYWLH